MYNTSYSIPEQPITLLTGETSSNTFVIADVDKVFLIAPLGLAQVATLEFSFDGGATWRNPLDNPITVTGGKTIDTAKLAPCSGLFNPSILWRITVPSISVADRTFILVGTK